MTGLRSLVTEKSAFRLASYVTARVGIPRSSCPIALSILLQSSSHLLFHFVLPFSYITLCTPNKLSRRDDVQVPQETTGLHLRESVSIVV
jgi:hypothetical protein